MEYRYEAGHAVSLLVDGVALWRYDFSTKHGKPFIHPLTTPGGVPLTAFEPWDKPWHRGLWYSWQYINGVNYWSEGPGLSDGEPAGRIQFVGPEEVKLSTAGAEVRSHYEYYDNENRLVLLGLRDLRFHPPKDGRYIIDWELSWQAKIDVTMRKAEATDSGESGLALRASRSLGALEVANSEGQSGDATNAQPAGWAVASGRADGCGAATGGVVIMDHPNNFKAPHMWNVCADDGFAFLNPSMVMRKELHFDTATGFTVNYRVIVFDGAMSTDAIKAAWEAYKAAV